MALLKILDPSTWATPVAPLSVSDYPELTDYSGTVEPLEFTVFDRKAVEDAFMGGGTTALNSLDPLVFVQMPVNPTGIEFSQTRIVERVRTLGATEAPNRTRNVIMDYGPDVAVIRINAQTGNLLPTKETTTRQSNPSTAVNASAGSSNFATIENLPKLGSKFWTTYSSIIQASPRHAAFMGLLGIYQIFSADDHIMTMTMMGVRLRGHIEDFSYPLEAEAPWNIHYTFNFVVIAGVNTLVNQSKKFLFSSDYVYYGQEYLDYFDEESKVLLTDQGKIVIPGWGKSFPVGNPFTSDLGR